MAAATVVWRYEMKPREMRALAELGLRMEVFQGERVVGSLRCWILPTPLVLPMSLMLPML